MMNLSPMTTTACTLKVFRNSAYDPLIGLCGLYTEDLMAENHVLAPWCFNCEYNTQIVRNFEAL